MSETQGSSHDVIDSFDLQHFSADGQRFFIGFLQVNANLLQAAIRSNAELADFTHRRLERDMQMSQKFAACRSFPDAVDVIQEFYKVTLDDYSAEIETLVQNGTEAAYSTANQFVHAVSTEETT